MPKLSIIWQPWNQHLEARSYSEEPPLLINYSGTVHCPLDILYLCHSYSRPNNRFCTPWTLIPCWLIFFLISHIVLNQSYCFKIIFWTYFTTLKNLEEKKAWGKEEANVKIKCKKNVPPISGQKCSFSLQYNYKCYIYPYHAIIRWHCLLMKWINSLIYISGVKRRASGS